jgi:hypothetical protein
LQIAYTGNHYLSVAATPKQLFNQALTSSAFFNKACKQYLKDNYKYLEALKIQDQQPTIKIAKSFSKN